MKDDAPEAGALDGEGLDDIVGVQRKIQHPFLLAFWSVSGRVCCSGYSVSGSRFRVSGCVSGFWVSGFGFRVSGFRFRILEFGSGHFLKMYDGHLKGYLFLYRATRETPPSFPATSASSPAAATASPPEESVPAGTLQASLPHGENLVSVAPV